MKNLVIYLFLLTITNAVLYSNQTNDPTKSFEIADFAEDDGYPISHRQDLFIDCSSYSSWLLASATAVETSVTESFPPLASVGPAVSSPTVPFEQYWCENFDETTEVGESIGPWLYGINASEKEYCLSLEKSNYSSWAVADPTPTTHDGYLTTYTTLVRSPSVWAPTLTQPCCGTLCQIVASRVQVYFWPTPAPYPNITTVVGSDGYVYTSPSVYVVYKNLHATGQCGVLGPSYSRITLSYHQTDLSTNVEFPQKAQPTAINYANLFTNCTSPVTVQGYGQSHGSDTSNDAIHCSPLLQLPAGLQSINPAWATCVSSMEWDVTGYAVDPPRALIPASALTPAQTEAADPTTTAAPVSLASQTLPSKTVFPSPPILIGAPSNDPLDDNHPSTRINGAGANGSPGQDPFTSHDPPAASSPSAETRPHTMTSPNPRNTAPQGNDPTKDPSPAGNIVPAGSNVASVDDTTAEDHASVSHSQLLGSDQHAGTDLTNSRNGNVDSSKDPSSPIDQHLGDASAMKTPAKIDPAGVETPFTTTIGGHVVQAASSARVVLVDGQSVSRGGGSITISDTPIALHSNGDLIFDTSVARVALSDPATFVTTIGGHVIQAAPLPGNIIIDGRSVTRGGGSITVSGTPIALHSDGNLVLGTSTVPNFLSNLGPILATVVTAADQSFTIYSNRVAIAGTTLTANSAAITLAGTPISLGAHSLVVGTSTISLPSPPPTSVITIAGQPYPISQAANGISIASTTLQIGQPAITISGTPIALGSSGLVVAGTSTVHYESILDGLPLSSDIGGLIFAGLSDGPVPSLSPTGSAASNGTRKTTTRPADEPQAFLGRGGRDKVLVYYLAAMTAILMLTPVMRKWV